MAKRGFTIQLYPRILFLPDMDILYRHIDDISHISYMRLDSICAGLDILIL